MNPLRHYNHLLQVQESTGLEDAADAAIAARAAELHEDIQQLSRLSDTMASLEDLRGILTHIPQASTEHLLLVENALNSLTAGTSYTAEALLPSLESFQGTQVSTEAINERIQSILKAILDFIRQIFRKLGQFVIELFEATKIQERRLTRLHHHIDDIEGSQPHKLAVRMGGDAYNLASDYGVPTDGRQLLVLLEQLSQQSQLIFHNYMPVVEHIGLALAPILQSWGSGSDPAEWLAALNRAAAPYNAHSFAAHFGSTSAVVDSRYAMGSAVSAKPLPGMRSIVFVDGYKLRPGQSDASVRGAMEQAIRLQLSNVELVRMHPSKEFDVGQATMETMPVSMMLDVVKQVGQLLRTIDERAKGPGAQALKDLEHAVEHITDASDDGIGSLKRGLQYVTTYQRWLKIHTDLLSLMYSVSRSAINLTARHVNAYHRPEAAH